MLRNSIINTVLKVGLCFSLLYTALLSLSIPERVISRWPTFISNMVSEQSLSQFTALASLGLIFWIISGKKNFSSSLTSTILIGLIMLLNIFSDRTYVFSLFPLFTIALALTIRYYPRIRVVVQTKVTSIEDKNKKTEHDQHIFIEKH